MNTRKINLFYLSSMIAIFFMILSVTTWAMAPPRAQRVITEVQRIETDDVIISTGNDNDTLDGVAFPPGANTLLTLKNTGGTLSLIDSQGDLTPVEGIPFFNIAYDGTSGASDTNGIKSVFIVDNNELINIESGSSGLNADSVTRQTWVPVTGARGMTMDPINNRLFTLQVNGQGVAALIIDTCGAGRECSGRESGRITVALPAEVGPKSHGVAFNPENGHVYILNQETLHELNLPGTARGSRASLVKSYGLSQMQLGSPIKYMTFAKSLDATDEEATFDLFVATSNEVIEMAFPVMPRIGLRIAPAAKVPATLIQTIDVSQFNPPSPDTAGLTYLEDSGTLLAADSEVNETPLFDGANVFEIDPDPVPGTLVDTFTTFPAFSDEPTGIVYDPISQHLFITDDNARKVYETDLSFNLIRQFDTSAFNSDDPEGIAFDPGEGALYIVDGVNKEVYKVMAGSNGIFDGIAPAGDDIVTSFDTCSLGIEDPEGITFQVETGDLLIIGDADPSVACDPLNIHNNEVVQVTTAGAAVQAIDISAPDPDSKNSAGLAVASSNSAGEFRIYVAARGLDSGSNRTENDGRIYEFSIQGAVTGNIEPQVSAGLDQTIVLPAGVTLDGTVTDDGLPNPPAIVTSTWSQVSGPGTTTFVDSSSAATSASFSASGVYVLRLSADDSDLTAFDEVTITVDPVIDNNQAPIVDAGIDQDINAGNAAILFGTVTDDGLPNPPGTVTSLWSQVSGPGVTSFTDPAMLETTATFSAAGVYVLRLSVNDGDLTDFNDVTITVNAVGQSNAVDVRVNASSDDAEEKPNGNVSLGSSDLELTFSGGEQLVGMRFNGIVIPKGATITNAYVQFQTDGITSAPTNLTIEGEAVDNAATYTNSNGNVSARPRTSSSANWIPGSWPTVGEAGLNQRTSNIASVIQEIVNRQNWTSGNSLAVMISGTGQRDAESFNGNANAAPLLHVEYTVGDVIDPDPSVNQAPNVEAGSDQTTSVVNGAALSGTVTDDGLPNPPGAVTSLWSQVSGPGTATFGSPGAVNTSASFDLVGTYVLRLTANDGEFTSFDELTVTVNLAEIVTMLDVRVSAGSDDAEENASTGNVNRGSSDLELVDQGRNNQLVGMRFNGLSIPQGATITNAFIQFNADETHSNPTTLKIEAQASDNALTFVSVNGNISSRPLTGTSVEWSPVPWAVVGEEGSNQQTPDISSVVQEVVDRSGWSSGNSLAVIMTGSGTRTAESFNGDSAAAPLLHMEYQ